MGDRKTDIEKRISQLPKGNISYKKIKGVEQPYLQWKEDGKVHCDYIKVADRERIFIELEERHALEDELRLLNTYSEKVADVIAKNAFISNHSALGHQRFADCIEYNIMYIDKTHFIEEWLNYDDTVTLITRPRRFGKTLMMSMCECFFSVNYKDKAYLFDHTYISKKPEIMKLQGTYPVISLTLGAAKSGSMRATMNSLAYTFGELFRRYRYLLDSPVLSDKEKAKYEDIIDKLYDRDWEGITQYINSLCELLYRHHNKPVIVMIDEYDTPLIDAYFKGYWDEMLEVISELFRTTLKMNPYLHKAILTGITRVSKESLFSDMNNIRVHSMMEGGFGDCFGFTEDEVRAILKVRDMDVMDEVKRWYDGYTIAGHTDIYNPWAILEFLSRETFRPFWTNTGGNALISQMLKSGTTQFLKEFEILLSGGSVRKVISEYITFKTLFSNNDNIYSLLLAAGYLRADNVVNMKTKMECDLSITNIDVGAAFEEVLDNWFVEKKYDYEGFCKSLVRDELEDMEDYLIDVFTNMVSFMDVAKGKELEESEKFYHGLVLGMIVTMERDYVITSNRESGRGRYDIMMRPKKDNLDGIIIEFKVFNARHEKTLEESANKGLKQIRDKNYAAELIASGVKEENIRKYCMAFDGKEVLIVKDEG